MSVALMEFFVPADAQAAAGINEQISFQGKVVNNDGTNVTNGSYSFLFCLYTTSSPATPCTAGANNDAVWRESKSLTVTDGIFQSNLGDTTTLPGSVDFNTDNIYLGINFNSDGQMTPLVRFTAAPYAMNADKVHGLSVTDTTGTLTIPNGKTISFADAFTTAGAFATTLTATGTTNVTLPTTGTLATLAGTEELTNKTIGSTGLTFSGATTDITTAAGEDLTLNSGTTGSINIGTDASAETINIGNTGAAVKTIAIGNNSQANTITIGDASVTGLSLTENNWSINTSGVASFVTGSTIGSLTFTTNNIADSGALTIKSATTNALTLDSGTTGTVNIATGTAGKTVNIGTDNTTKDTINIGSALDDVAITGDQWSITNAGVLTVVSCSGCGGGGSTLDSAYTAGNTITTDSGSNVIVTLQEVVAPTSFVIENQDTAGVSAQRIFNSIASGTLTNGLLIEQTGAGTLTNGIQIAETAGTITDGILITGTLSNILNSSSIDITGTGAITGATWLGNAIGVSYGGTGIDTSLDSGIPTISAGTWSVASTLGASYLTADSLDFTEFKDAMTLDASTDISVTGTNVFSVTNSGTGNSFVVNDASGDTTPFIIDAAGVTYFNGTSNGITIDGANTIIGTTTPQDMILRTVGGGYDLVVDSGHNVGIGTASPGANLTVFGATTTALQLNSGASAAWDFTTDYSVAGDLVVSRSSGSGDFVISGVNVGIGDTSPDGLFDFDFTGAASAVGATEYGGNFTYTDSTVTTSGTDNDYGLYTTLTRTGATTSGATAVNTYGNYVTLSHTGAASGTINAYGSYITATGDTGGTSTLYGQYVTATGADTTYGVYSAVTAASATTAYALYADAGAGAGTEYAGAFVNGNVGIGTATPTSSLHVVNAGSSSAGPTFENSFTGSAGGIFLYNNNTADGNSIKLNFDTNANGPSRNTYAMIAGGRTSNLAGFLTFNTTVGGATGERARIDSVGNFGIGGDATPDSLFSVGTTSQFQVNSSGAIAATTGITSSGALAANGGITFDASTDTVGAFTAAGTIDMSTQILTNIGNTGTDFVASTGALTLAGILTANGGVSLAGSQSFTASALAYMDLGAITQSSTANQGLRLPNAASATPSNPTSGEGYLAWDAAGNQLITYNGSAWTTLSGGSGYNLIKDETTGLAAQTTLAFLGAGVSCADNVTQTECTISGGGSSDLQATYDADANGSNVTISLTAADDGLVFTNPTSGGNDLSAFLLQLTQQNTTAAVTVLDMVQSSNAANAVNLTANSIDGETGLAITTNGLTSGKGISITSSATAFTGNLADISLTGSNASNTGNVLAVSNTGTANANTALFVDHRATGTGNLAVRVDDQSSDTTPFVIDGTGKVGIQTSAPSEALEVGSLTNRANIAAYGDITSEGYDIQRNLTGIIDIFVYDTSRDSDGGEWRNSLLSQQLSWATETKDNTGADCVIGTDDRCGESAFPRKAILVTTASALYIFNGADNTLWMTFTQAGTYALGADTNNNPSGVGAQNGVVIVGTNGASATGMYAIDFKQDTMFRYNATNRVQGDKNIGNRNSTVSYATDANTNMAIIDTVVNDVSVAMITSSTNGMANTLTLPLDSATGPVRGMTLIAAATDSGVSVVNMAARKTLSYSDATNNDYNQVVMTSRARMYATNETLGQLEEWRNMDRDVVAEVNGTPDRVYDETTPNGAAGKTPITTGTTPVITTSPGSLAVIERSSSARESAATTLLESGDIVFVGTDQGLAEVHTSGGNLLGASWSKITTTTVATPYMVGAPRGVFLFDDAAGATSTASAVGTTGSTRQVLDTAGATSPTFGGGGVRGTSVNFNNNSYLCSDANSDGTCDADTDFNAGTIGFTVSLWFKHSTTAAQDALFERCYTPATPTAAVGCIYAGMTASGTIRFAIDSLTTWTYDTTYDDTIVSTAAYNDNQWHHAVFTNTDTDICMYIDGKQAVACDTSLAATATMDASQVLTVGGVCSGANCTTGTNFWDGSIDDMVWSSNGATTDNGLAAQSATKLYLDGRAHLIRPAASVTDATTFSSTTIGDSGESYTPGTFAGLVVELTGGTGAGQTRTIVSNDSTTFTVTPAWSTTPDTTTDYAVSSSRLYGSSNNVTAIAPDLPTNINRTRKVYVGTSDGSDGGGISVFTNAGTGSIKTEVIHSDAGYATDDLGSSWSGTDADDISAMAAYSDTVAFGNGAFMRTKRASISLKQLQLDYGSALEDIRQELVSKQLFGSTQDVLGLGQGADLAERYYSDEKLNAGEIVSIDSSQEAGVKRSTLSYQRDVIGVVATAPGLVLGPQERSPYPIALVGRVPVKVTNENGQIYAGDRITASSRSGYGMYAQQAGRVIGQALSDAADWVPCEGENPEDTQKKLCTTVLVFVNLTDYTGQSVELAMAERDAAVGADGLSGSAMVDGAEQGLGSDTGSIRLATSAPTKQEQILSFLKELHEKQLAANQKSSEVFTGRVAASTEVITPTLYADQIFAKSIKADSIEGLSIWTNQLASLEQKYAGLQADVAENGPATDLSVTSGTALLNLDKFTVGSFTASLDASILGKLALTGGMTVGGDAQFGGNTVFAKLANFLGKTIFKDVVSFEAAPNFGSDTAGFAVIEAGAKKVRVTFDTPYQKQPIVAVTLTNDESPLLSGADDDLKADIKTVEKEYLESVFKEDIRYVVTEKSVTGFTVVLSNKAPKDLQFSWVALSVDKVKSFNSEKEKSEEAVPVPVIQPAIPAADIPVDTTAVPIVVPAETSEPTPLSETIPAQ